MEKLIAKYVDDPSEKNKAKCLAHANKHPMSVCLLNPEDLEVFNKISEVQL